MANFPPPPSDAELFGLVLAGGKSSRMKTAKAHLVIHGSPQWASAERAISPWCQTVLFSVSPQLDPPLPISQGRLVRDLFLEPIGPLGGIMSAFKRNPQVALMVLACDLPYFDSDAARFLIERRNSAKKATAFVHEGLVEPLCTIYEPTIFSDLAIAWARGVYCPRAILAGLDVERIQAEDPRWLTNVNYAHELVDMTNNVGNKNVKILYYASLREQAGVAEEELLTSATTMWDLFLEVKAKRGLQVSGESLRFAKNDQLVLPNALIEDRDSIVFIPPVSGG